MKPNWPFGWKLPFDRPATALDRALVGQRARDNFGLNCSAPGECLAILAAGGADVAVQPIERKLAAIFAADIASYSRPKGRDEARTLAQLKACRIIISGLIAPHRCRISGPEDMAHLRNGLRLAGLSG
jgi:hypothetical protein